ncbi:MAG: type II toxin-antitoxin system Phd/YefM family antitoxin [Coriobacteriales bacterium]|nr:type II toxin-antitoxin system Phd/YefM family antitoxin [Coriobacteriales bacterium]
MVLMLVMSAREFNQNTSKAKLLAREEPVFVTNRGSIQYVLLNIDEYQSLAKPPRTLADTLAMDESEYFEYDFPRLEGDFREVDF